MTKVDYKILSVHQLNGAMFRQLVLFQKYFEFIPFVHFKGRPGELFFIPQKMIAQWAIQAWGIEMNIKLNFILISEWPAARISHITREPQINDKLINLTFYFLPFYPLTTTAGRQGVNAGIPESKALFVVWKDEWLRRLLVTICGPCTDKLFNWWGIFHLLVLVSWLLISLAPWIKDSLLPFC